MNCRVNELTEEKWGNFNETIACTSSGGDVDVKIRKISLNFGMREIHQNLAGDFRLTCFTSFGIGRWFSKLFSTWEIVAKWKIDIYCVFAEHSSRLTLSKRKLKNFHELSLNRKVFRLNLICCFVNRIAVTNLCFNTGKVACSRKHFVLFCFCRIRECPCTGVGGFRGDFGKLKMWAGNWRGS